MAQRFDPVAETRRYHEALNRFDLEAVAALMSPDAVYLSSGVGGRLQGRDSILAAFRIYFETYPDQIATDDSIDQTSSDSARAMWRLVATHSASGEVIRRQGCEIVLFNPDGLIGSVEVEDVPSHSA